MLTYLDSLNFTGDDGILVYDNVQAAENGDSGNLVNGQVIYFDLSFIGGLSY